MPLSNASLHLTFDRGTIVIQGSGSILEQAQLQGVLWDPRVACYRAPGYQFFELCDSLRRNSISFVSHLAEHEAIQPPINSPSLRAYQQQALWAWELSQGRGLLILPTGSGKTFVALAAMALHQQPTLILVSTRVLLAQWAEKLATVYTGPVGLYGDGSHQIRDVTITTFESAYRHMDLMGQRFGMIVVDEVHHFASGLRAEALEMCTARYRLGLTATLPQNLEKIAFLEKLVGPVACQLSIPDLVGEHLAPFDQIRLFIDLNAQERAAYQHTRSTFLTTFRQFCRLQRGATWQEFVAIALKTQAGSMALRGFYESRQIVGAAQAKLELTAQLLKRHQGDRLLIFTADNTLAYALSRRFLIPAITCHIKRRERATILELFKQGKVRALVSARVLNEGIDLPDARIGIVLGGNFGSCEHQQRVGRLLRPQKGKRALLYEIVARDTYEVDHANKRQRVLFG